MRRSIFSGWFLKRLAYLAAATVLFAYTLSLIIVHAGINDVGPDWTAPRAIAIRRVGSASGSQSTPTLFNNLDCTPVKYRLVTSSTMEMGCFTETAFGLLDSDSYVVIFNGTDEGLPLLPYVAHQILAPWPKSMDLVALSPLSTGGALVRLYKNPVAIMQDQRNLLGQLTAKQLTAPPDLTLNDASGKPLIINAQTLAFSDGGSWLAAETLNGSFVRVNLATLAVKAFAPSYGSQGSPGLLQSRVAISESGRFIAIENDIAEQFKIYDLDGCGGSADDLRADSCRSYDYHAFAGQQIIGLRSVRRLRFINEGLLSFEAGSTDPANGGLYELAPEKSITSLTDYIALGDSYTSGEGAFDYLEGTDTPDDTCHLSRKSYPLLLTHDLFNASGGHSVACSGAVINDIGNTSSAYKGQVRTATDLKYLQDAQPQTLESIESDFMPGYVAQQRFVKRWQPGIVTVSIGGNDIGFGDILQNCVEPHLSLHLSDNTCYDTYEDRLELSRLIDRTVPRWTELFTQLEHEAPDGRLYAIGYPQVAVDNGKCALNVQLAKSELELAAEVIAYINQSIETAAGAAGATYVDISQALKGHRLCEASGYDVAVNGLTAGNDSGIFGMGILGRESYHPNALGHELIEQAILKQTHNLSAPGGYGGDQNKDSNPATMDSQALLNAPRSGRTVYALVPDDNLTRASIARGLRIPIKADGGRDGLKPNSTYDVRLDGPNGPILGTVNSLASGDISGTVAVPNDTPAGGHTIDIIGENQVGDQEDLKQPIYVKSSDSDEDGDGIENITDSCPAAINGAQDKDRDGVDDICDEAIGPSVRPGEPGGQTSDSGNPYITGRSGPGRVLGTYTAATGIPPRRTPRQHLKHKVNLQLLQPGRGKTLWLAWAVLAVLVMFALLKKYTKTSGFRLQ